MRTKLHAMTDIQKSHVARNRKISQIRSCKNNLQQRLVDFIFLPANAAKSKHKPSEKHKSNRTVTNKPKSKQIDSIEIKPGFPTTDADVQNAQGTTTRTRTQAQTNKILSNGERQSKRRDSGVTEQPWETHNETRNPQSRQQTRHDARNSKEQMSLCKCIDRPNCPWHYGKNIATAMW